MKDATECDSNYIFFVLQNRGWELFAISNVKNEADDGKVNTFDYDKLDIFIEQSSWKLLRRNYLKIQIKLKTARGCSHMTSLVS